MTRDTLLEAKQQVRRESQTAISSASTLEGLLEVWPEIEQYVLGSITIG